MKESLTQEVAVAEPLPQGDTTQAIVPHAGPRTLTTREGLEGDFDVSDLQIPRLNLVGKTSKLVSKTVPAGVFVLNGETIVGDGEKPFKLAVLTMQKSYWQKLPDGSNDRPMVFKTIREVEEAGGSIEYGATDVIPFQKAARVIGLIESSEEKDNFMFEDEGKFYALFSWFLASTAYSAAATKFVTDLALRRSASAIRYYDVTSRIETNSKGSWYLPVVRITPDTVTEALLEQAKTLIGG